LEFLNYSPLLWHAKSLLHTPHEIEDNLDYNFGFSRASFAEKEDLQKRLSLLLRHNALWDPPHYDQESRLEQFRAGDSKAVEERFKKASFTHPRAVFSPEYYELLKETYDLHLPGLIEGAFTANPKLVANFIQGMSEMQSFLLEYGKAKRVSSYEFEFFLGSKDGKTLLLSPSAETDISYTGAFLRWILSRKMVPDGYSTLSVVCKINNQNDVKMFQTNV
jgi:hypothetical protein